MPVYDDPWKLKFFNFTDFINSSRAEFTGHQWLYQQMESVLQSTDNRGVLITGTPGSGKSAFLRHLLCSKTSSPVVHSRILAHHFCMHFHKKTPDGVTFVRNLANMIAWKLSEYRQRILTDSFVRRVLKHECSEDPEWCFEHGIVRPLKEFRLQPKASWYIVVDALDECFSDKADVVNILKSKARRLPRWLKLIVSSRNVKSIVTGLEGFHSLELRSASQEKREDIDTYLTLKVSSLKESVVERFKTSFSIRDNDAPTQVLVSNIAEKGHGNFLYVKVMLDLWLTSAEKINWETFPKTLESTYQLYFERKFSTFELFRSLREIFEVLVAAYRYTPLTIEEMHSLFILENPTLDLEYDFMPKLDQVSIFLWHGSEGDLRIDHASLSEWLTSDANKGKACYVKKRNGHNRLAKYYLEVAAGRMLNPYEAFHLASHVVEGGLDKVLVKQFLSLPSGNVDSTESWSQTTALHLSASSRNTNVIKLLLQHFFNVDCLDNNKRTPSFIAATAGQVGNLLALFDRGANPHHTTAYLDAEIESHSVDSVKECKRRRCGYSLLHTAAQEGNLDVVKFLLQHNITISKTSGSNNTAIQLAAENGHRDTVMMLRNAGGIPDGLSLHHSASNGHILVVKYLLKEGVIDTCIQGTPRLLFVNVNDEELNSTKKYVHDISHLHFRETALHAAVRREHLSVIEVLLRKDQNAVNCKNSAGRNLQHEAVYLNKYNSLKALLESGTSASIQCSFEISSSLLHHQSVVPKTLQEDGCPCGFTPLHLAGSMVIIVLPSFL
ncbi:ankyrin repeat domain-containing protein 50-like [Montipora capricornis]|uniref:ankyrin repeat domain-containing protein 50-like n=1 Tax=Montipora capricornis TaxID=246305 RepID=UPI0035F1C4FF